MLESVLKDWGAYEVTPMDAYTAVFRLGEGYIQRSDEPPGSFKANPIGYYKKKGAASGHFRVFFEDTFEETLQELQGAEFTLLNGITYFGRRNVQEHASKMFALIFDLDGVTDKTLNSFLSGAIVGDAYPVPNYIALSGHGIHLYYLFDEPVSLFPYIKIQLKELKYALTDKLWNSYTSIDDKVQHQGINQGFRVLGGMTKDDAEAPLSRVFALNAHPFTLEQLCEYVPEEHRVDQTMLWKESRYTLAQAKKKFPEWYAKVIEGGDREPKYWDIAGKVHGDNPYALYDWWKRQIRAGASYGHRYFAIMALAIYGAKNDKEFADVKADAYDLVPFLNSLNPSEPFTEEDCDVALECYDRRYKTFPIKDLTKITGIDIPRNKRNGQTQEWHLEDCRDKKKRMKRRGQPFKRPEGRPAGSGTSEQKVVAYRKAHPEASVTEVAKALGISRPTVYKWWAAKTQSDVLYWRYVPGGVEPVYNEDFES